MSFDSRIREKLLPIVDPVEPKRYKGNALEYIVFNYSTYPTLFAEGRPHAFVHFLQVHYYLPHGVNPNQKLGQIAAAIFDIGCTWPSIVDASDDEGQHYVLECQGKD